MYNKRAYELGNNRCTIRDLAEYGAARAEVIGRENVYDFTIGNPSLPAPREIGDAIQDVLADMGTLAAHSYTSAPGDKAARAAIAADLNNRFGTHNNADELFLDTGASAGLCTASRALSQPG